MDSTSPANPHANEIRARVHGLELDRQAAELDRIGVAIVDNVAPPDFVDQLRSECVDALDASDGAQAAVLLSRGGIFDDAVCLPKVFALAESMLGKGCLLSQVVALRQGQLASGGGSSTARDLLTGVHCDLVGIREPFGPYPWSMTAAFALDDWSEGSGASAVVPGSHRLQRHPIPDVDGQDLVSLRMPKGSVAIWNGALHRGRSPRTIPGASVTLHVTYCQLVLRPWEDYSEVARELRRGGCVDSPLASLLGLRDPFGKNDERGPRGDDLTAMRDWVSGAL